MINLHKYEADEIHADCKDILTVVPPVNVLETNPTVFVKEDH